MNEWLVKLRARWVAWYRGSPLEQFLRWWWQELHALAPGRVRAWLDYRPEFLLVVREDDADVVYRAGGDRPAELERLRPELEEAGVTRERIERALKTFEESDPRRVFCLPAGQVLIKRLTLPAAAAENLVQVLSYEMDRHTPFSARQVYFDYRVLKRDPRTRALDVELVVSPRNALDEAVERFQARGLELSAVDVAAGSGHPPALMGVNLLPVSARRAHARGQVRLNLGLAAAAVVLMVLVMWQALALKQARIQALETRIKSARESAMEVAALRKDLQQAVEAANYLMERKRREPVLVNVLREATAILPDDTWLERLQVSEGEVRFLGETPSAAKIIGIIDESPLLAEATFISPVTANSRTNTERFHIESRILADKAPFDGPDNDPGRGQPVPAPQRAGTNSPSQGSDESARQTAARKGGQPAKNAGGRPASSAGAAPSAGAARTAGTTPPSHRDTPYQAIGNGTAAPRS